MARGKKGAQAQRKADQSAIDTIDRLTQRLAEEHRRRLDAEAVARRYSHEDNAIRLLEAQNDEALAVALDKLRWWQQVAAQDHERRLAAFQEIRDHLRPDMRLGNVPQVEWIEFLERRYPRIITALTAGKWAPDGSRRPFRNRRSPFARMEKKLSDEQLIRFQQVTGQRSTLKDGTAAGATIDWALTLEATQAGFTSDEVLELLADDD